MGTGDVQVLGLCDEGGLGQAGPVETVWPKPHLCPQFSLSLYKITQDCFAGVFPLCCSHGFLRCLLPRDTQARICAGRKGLNNLLWRCQIPHSHLGVPTSHWSLPLYGSSCRGEGNSCCHYFAVEVGEEHISFTAKPKLGENSSAKDKGQVRRMVAEASGCS